MSNRTFALLLGLPTVAIFAAILFFQFDVGKRDFEPESVANKIVLATGASNAKNVFMTGPACSVARARVCMGHDQNPLEVQRIINRMTLFYKVDATGPWDESATGAMRFYRFFDGARPKVFSVAVTPEVVVIDW